jgi:hypothetical protein
MADATWWQRGVIYRISLAGPTLHRGGGEGVVVG